VVAENAFAPGATVQLDLERGSYLVRPAADDHVRITFSGNVGHAKAALTADGSQARVGITDTPSNNFQATIDVPSTADLVVRLTGGNLKVAAIAGSKDIESMAGNVEIAVGDPSQYSRVDGSVKAGNIEAGAFGGSKSGLFQHFTWTGTGTHALRATLGAGNLSFHR
jgi:hypothetical protein